MGRAQPGGGGGPSATPHGAHSDVTSAPQNVALRARTWSGSSCHRGSPVAVRACRSQRRGWRSHVAPELQPAPPCGAGVRDVTRETTARSEDIRPVTIRRVPRLPGSRSPWRFSTGWVWEVRGTSPLPSVSPLVLQGLGTEGRRGTPTPLGPGVGSRPAPSPDRCHARVPSHFCGRKNGLLFCTLGWRGEGRLPFLSLNHTCNLLLSAPRAPEAPSSP